MYSPMVRGWGSVYFGVLDIDGQRWRRAEECAGAILVGRRFEFFCCVHFELYFNGIELSMGLEFLGLTGKVYGGFRKLRGFDA